VLETTRVLKGSGVLQFDRSCKNFGKIEDDVPAFFKRVKYPFQLSKTALVAVGSPHTWPALLGALVWLAELLAYRERVVRHPRFHT
jgi:kinetochore protein NDC80